MNPYPYGWGRRKHRRTGSADGCPWERRHNYCRSCWHRGPRAEVIVHVAVPGVGAALDDSVDHAAGLMADRSVEHGGLRLKFLNGVDAGGEVPLAAVIADRGAVQHEHVVAVAGARPVELIAGVDVPAAGTGEARRAELLLSKDHARSEGQQHVALSSIQRIFLGLKRIEHEAAIGVSGVENFLLSGDRDLGSGLTDGHLEVHIQPLRHLEGDLRPLERLKARCRHVDRINARDEIRDRVNTVRTGFCITGVIGRDVGRFDRCVRDCGSRRIRNGSVSVARS